jgi:PIN domain nuclease of toxin-antitoxin system
MIFLDTHVVVWLYQGDKARFSYLAMQLLDSEELVLSPAVELELQYLFEIGRITSRGGEILAYLGRTIGLQVNECSFKSLVGSALDLSWTRDPFDRLICAHAALHSAPLITKDEKILRHYRHARWD